MARSRYYYAKKPKYPTAQQLELQGYVRQVFQQSRGSAGSRSIAHMVSQHYGIQLSRYKARKIMQQLDLHSKQQLKHHYRHADTQHHIHDNVLNREFQPTAPNQIWTGDVTYIRTKQGFCYLAVVIDLYARNVVGFAMSDRPDSQLTARALQMAYNVRLCPQNVLFHSDQGTHYSSQCFAEQVGKCAGMQHSMSRKGNCWDNAPTERFFRSYKTEWMPKHGYHDLAEAKADVVAYIFDYYSIVRPHSFNDYLSPVAKENLFFKQNLLEIV